MHEHVNGFDLLRICADGRGWWICGTGVEARRMYSPESSYLELHPHWQLVAALSIDVDDETVDESQREQIDSYDTGDWTDWLVHHRLLDRQFDTRDQAVSEFANLLAADEEVIMPFLVDLAGGNR